MNTTLSISLNDSNKLNLMGFRTARENDGEFDRDEYNVMLIDPDQHFMITLRYSCNLVKETEWGGSFSLEDELDNKNFVPEIGDVKKGIVNRQYFDDMGCIVSKGTPDADPEVTYKLESKDIERCLKDFLEFVEVSSLEELLQESDEEDEPDIQAE